MPCCADAAGVSGSPGPPPLGRHASPSEAGRGPRMWGPPYDHGPHLVGLPGDTRPVVERDGAPCTLCCPETLTVHPILLLSSSQRGSPMKRALGSERMCSWSLWAPPTFQLFLLPCHPHGSESSVWGRGAARPVGSRIGRPAALCPVPPVRCCVLLL